MQYVLRVAGARESRDGPRVACGVGLFHPVRLKGRGQQ